MVTRIYVAGHRGMVGAAITRKLEIQRETAADITIITRTRADLELTDQTAVKRFFADERPDVVILAAAKVGGIYANNTYPAQFIWENMMMQCNVIHAAWDTGVNLMLQLGSSCIYPHAAPQPMSEQALLSGPLEPTNEPYAIAKIAGIKMCESYNRQYGTDYRSIMPTNLYGPGDNFHPENSHVLPAMIRRFHEAKKNGCDKVVIWGTGNPMREFMHVDDMADAALFVLNLDPATYKANTQPMLSHINVGSGHEVTILDLAHIVARVVGFEGAVVTDPTKPDGAKRKLMDTSRLLSMGWRPSIGLERGIQDTYQWFINNQSSFREK